MDNQAANEQEIFFAALELTDTVQQRKFIESACAGDPSLRKQVEDLLAAHEEDMLHVPADTVQLTDGINSYVGQMIGHFKVLEKIGEGGFGDVYMVDQLEPIQRRVALKIIKTGMDTKQVIARFEAERQALSLMNHPNIAMVLDAGTTEAGRPFFVMELVRGVPVTEYCDEERLSTSERLTVFADICAAIQHAHQKGIIHRDIKPSNVLVTNDGDRPVPKVIDFGVAKATQGRLTDKTLFTQFRQFIGTPAYMSPEQARMSVRDVDTRTDIYSLGVLLYELLTGNTPLDAKKLQCEGLDEICQRIRDEEPPKPSTRLSTMTLTERGKIANQRKAEPDKLGRLMRGELDWMVMKAIEKDRVRRYETAEGFAADVRRYLSNEPVMASPPSSTYRLKKFVSRNWVAVSTMTAIALALIVGTAASTIGLVEARWAQHSLAIAQGELTDQLTETEEARQEAELNLYVSDMNRASTAYDDGNIGLALSLMAKHKASYGDRFEWKCLRQLCQGDALHTFRGHSQTVNSVAVSQHGVIASGSSDGTFRLYDIKTREPIASREMSSGVIHVDFSPDGQVLGVAEENNKITIWDVESLEQMGVFPRDKRNIWDIEFAPDGVTLAVTGGLSLWNWQAGTVLQVPRGEAGGRHVSFSPTGEYICLVGPTPQMSLAKASEKGTYKKYAHMPFAHGWAVLDSAFSRPDEEYLATTGRGGQIRMWDIAAIRQAELTGKPAMPVSILQGKRSSHGTSKLLFSPDGRYLASGGGRGYVNLWRGRPPWQPEESELVTWRGHTSAVTSIAYSHDGAFIVSGSGDHTVKLWPGDTRQKTTLSSIAKDWLFAVAFSPDDQMLATGGFDGRVRLFDTKTMEKRFDEKLHDNQVMGVAISPNGKWLASCEGGWRYAGDISYYSPGRGISLVNLRNPAEKYYVDEIPVSVLGAIDFSPDSRSLAVGDFNGHLWLWDVEQRLVRKKAVGAGGRTVCSVRYSPNGETIAVGGDKRPLELRNADSLEVFAEFASNWNKSLNFSPDGQILAAAQGETIRLFDTSNLKEMRILDGHTSTVWGVAFLPDGKTLASGSQDHAVKLWNIETGQEVATLRGHRGGVTGLAVSHDGNMLASSGEDKTVRIWHAGFPDKPIQQEP